MKVAITGAAGYLGTQVIQRLQRDPKVETVVAVDRVRVRPGPKVRPVVRDVLDPRLGTALAGCDAVIHLAFIIGDSRNRPALYRVNVDGSRNVFEAAASAGAKRLVVASSIAAYGYYPDNPPVMDEACPLRGNPDNAYSDTKRLVEFVLDDFEKRHPSIAVVRLRPGVVLGPNTRNNYRTLLGLPVWFDIVGDGPGFFSRAAVVHEEDLADAFALAVRRGRGAYNLAVEPFVTREQILERTGQIPVRVHAAPLAPLMEWAFRLKLSDSPASDLLYAMYPIPATGKKAVRELGWRPRYTGLDAVEALVENIRRERKGPLAIRR